MTSAAPSTTKLRLSCDECLLSKVRCEKQKPTCERCQGLGKACVYGTSRKLGRPSSGRQKGSLPTSAMHVTCIAPRADLDPMQLDTSIDLLTAGPALGGDIGLWDDLVNFDAMDTLEILQNWNEFGDPSQAQTPEVGYQSASQQPSITAPALSNLGENMTASWAAPEQDATFEVSKMPASVKLLIGGCAFEAHAIMGTLNCASKHSIIHDLIRTTPTALSSETSENAILRLDNILQRSKVAVSSVTRLLDCSCGREPHVAMMHASPVSKILSWYEVAAHHLPLAAALPTFSQSPSGSLLQNLDSTGLQATSSGIRFGSFLVNDAADQAVLHKHLLLIEIGKVNGLIDKMLATSRQQPLSSAEGGLFAVSWHKSYSHVVRAKVQELRDSINEQH
ncbi:hypothetical protein LTR37_012099 [Vermiconidia calcicola]|uniref:Uncharacterized protein n=1 Tax=Vermiconidia calcicola TaxID=1690605 RepID=A0ACC3N0H2_9PEZI|nr:hypothetical protein LTR37_012099 [Vermiconidia calcicola]